MIRLRQFLIVAVTLAITSGSVAQQPAWKWYDVDEHKTVRVHLYLFWSQTCPHCPPAVEFVRQMQQRHPWLAVTTYETSQYPGNRALYQQMAASLNRAAGQTPAFFFCKQLEMGYISYEHTGRRIEQSLIRWHDALQKHFRPTPVKEPATSGILLSTILLLQPGAPPGEFEFPDLPIDLPPEPEKMHIPGLGEVEANDVSLPMVTLILAACDSFNPCAFFVLLLLLSMLVHGHSRWRMAIVGGTFITASGVMYFLFMAAWLNLFFVVGHLRLITVAAGLLALVVGVLNAKDFFWFKRGPSLSIPESAKPGLFQRMARLINVSSLPALLFGSAALACLANLYELLCTSGFPMVYTRILTLRELPTGTYYGYLALYNLVYVAPMALIVLGFVMTLGSRKLTEREGRVLKLLSGVMMLALAAVLLFWPTLLHSAVGAVATLGLALAVTATIVTVDWWRRRPPTEVAVPPAVKPPSGRASIKVEDREPVLSR